MGSIMCKVDKYFKITDTLLHIVIHMVNTGNKK